jgi:signal peptidase I
VDQLKRLLFLIILGVAGAWMLRAVAVEGVYIASASMEPTLPVGRALWLDKLTYRFRSPRRREIVILKTAIPPYEDMGKRIIAISGDEVELRDKALYINGELQTEDYVQHTRAGEKLQGDNLGPLTVPEDHVFVLGDNRDRSNDSAVWKDPETGEPAPFVPLGNVRGLLRGIY